jgi:hypothetical protein
MLAFVTKVTNISMVTNVTTFTFVNKVTFTKVTNITMVTFVTKEVNGTFLLLLSRLLTLPHILVYIQRAATLHSLFISVNHSTCFGWYLHPLSGAHTPVSTASGICYTVTANSR